MRTRTWMVTCTLTCTWILAGCAVRTASSPPVEPVPVVKAAPARAEPDWSAYLERTRAMSVDDLARETAEAAASAQPWSRLQLAMLLVAPQSPNRDDARAQALAEELATLPGAPARARDVAAVFAQLLAEQRRSTEAGRRAQARAADDQKRLDQLDMRARDAERRAAEAERKLEALKQIDKALNERAPSPPGSPRQ